MTHEDFQDKYICNSYHDLYVTTAEVPRTRFFDLPFGFSLECLRQSGWILTMTNLDTGEKKVVAGEYDKWLILDIKGNVFIDSRSKEIKEIARRMKESKLDLKKLKEVAKNGSTDE